MKAISVIQYCKHCGAKVNFAIPPGDSLPRHICNLCGHIHYENPRLVVGGIAEWEGNVLLCRRAIEPRYGFWTLPAGFMENGETTSQAAVRETQEEAGAKILIDAPFSLISIPHINQVHLFYRGRMTSPDFAAGIESLEVMLCDLRDVPWKELAFRSVSQSLRLYIEDRANGTYNFHESELSAQ